MPLAAGTRLGPYEITAPVGEGGMGEVYRARDTRLNRTVAVKVIKGEFSHRFEREAKTISSLNHPYICSLYDIGSENGSSYLVMEYVEGKPLRGPLPVEEALAVGAQIAAALEEAHRKGVVHRDLKPANVLRTRDGVKLLDFGIARQRETAPLQEHTPSETITDKETIVGTLYYMAPEQLEGKEADARSDIFSFGCVLYELVTGSRAFDGESRASVITAIMSAKPRPMAELQPLAPPALDRVVRKCLAKDPDKRWQSAQDLGDELRWIAEAPAPVQVTPQRSKWRALAAVLAVVAAVFLGFRWGSRGAEGLALGEPVRFQIYPPDGMEFSSSAATVPAPQIALSPDGRYVAFTVTGAGGSSSLWVRPLTQASARMLPGTDGASFPFWSPDSRQIGYFAEGKLLSIPVDFGPPLQICDAGRDAWGGAWAPDGTILFTLGIRELSRVPASGGRPEPATELAAGEVAHRWPAFLPDGRRFLFHMRGADDAHRGIFMGSLDDPTWKRHVLLSHNAGVPAPNGLLLYLDGLNLMARQYDERSGGVGGEPQVAVEQVGGSTNSYSAVSVSRNGILAYARPMAFPGKLTWYGREGRQLGVIEPEGEHMDFRISPSGDRIALTRQNARTANPDIWLFDTARETTSRFTTNEWVDAGAVWSSDGSRVYFRSNRSGEVKLYGAEASNPAKVDVVLQSKKGIVMNAGAYDVSSNGKYIIYGVGSSTFDLYLLPLLGEQEVRPVVATAFNEIHGAISPDGRWLAYVSDESGRYEVYVTGFPNAGATWQVSTQGGWEPRWRDDGRELFFLAPERKLMAAPASLESTPRFGAPRVLFLTNTLLNPHSYRRNYDVAPGGERFLINTLSADTPRPAIEVILNWQSLLRQ